VGYAVPFGWFFGRVACYLVHDHPGLRTSSWLAVKYPGGARYDLGLLEAMFLVLLCGAFWLLARAPRPPGFFFGAFFLAYGVFRVGLDQLHVDPPRYAGISVDHWAYGAATLAGAAVLWHVYRAPEMLSSRTAPEERSSAPSRSHP
jgi:phosphatidylglycerol---prolipoprotein diacylglyceryl transferase